MMHRFESEPAYVLHSWPYRETSLLLEVFTREYGRLGALAKGARRPKSRARGLLQPFVPLLVACVGRGELLTLTEYESFGFLPYLSGRRLVSAFYLNELIMRLLHRWDPNPALFDGYQIAIRTLASEEPIEPALRLFEKVLLKTLGYELQLVKEVESGEAVHPEKLYRYDPERGPILVDALQKGGAFYPEKRLYQGKSLLALAAEELSETSVLSEVKRLMREALLLHLGDRPIESRKLL
jgi:DNA repair protein RecO (recombination protein O)